MARDFFDDYDCVVVLGCFRFGSTALATMIKNWYNEHGYGCLYLQEYFTGHHYVVERNGQYVPSAFPDDNVWFGDDQQGKWLRLTTQRPMPPYLMQSKLDWLVQRMADNKIVIKIDPPDLQGPGGLLIRDQLLSNPRVFKLGLNRQDVGNAMISYAIGYHFNFWNFGPEMLKMEYEKSVEPVKAAADPLQVYVNDMVLHNTWLLHNMGMLQGMVWCDQLGRVDIPAMGMQNYSKTWVTAHHVPHDQRVQRYFTNHAQLLDLANAVERNMAELIDEVRRLSHSV
jgi:hypothetical protein